LGPPTSRSGVERDCARRLLTLSDRPGRIAVFVAVLIGVTVPAVLPLPTAIDIFGVESKSGEGRAVHTKELHHTFSCGREPGSYLVLDEAVGSNAPNPSISPAFSRS
jgi:hypothetical protein